tara:strand:- start:526 stop:711 length:186 start_codon:yes stop_codon:yes gene_type:complete
VLAIVTSNKKIDEEIFQTIGIKRARAQFSIICAMVVDFLSAKFSEIIRAATISVSADRLTD